MGDLPAGRTNGPQLISPVFKFTSSTRERQAVRGLIVEVSAASLKKIKTLIVDDKLGDRHSFIQLDEIVHGVTPVHLREHMNQQWPVTIIFHWESGVVVIDDVTD